MIIYEQYMEKSSFRLVFGDSPVIKVLDFLLDNREFDYSLSDIARGADVGWSTLHQFWNDFVKLGLVKRTRKIGRAELYKLDATNSLVKKMLEMDWEISKMFAQREVQEQKEVVM